MEGVAIEREREYTLTVVHNCHRTRIPFGHVLIEHRCEKKHCKKRKCNKEKNKEQPTTKTTKRYRSKNKKNQNV
jgi:hypothetical protein